MSLRHVLLVVLSKGEMTGYDISKQFDISVGFFWETTHQQVYRALKTLNRDGLVTFRNEIQQGKPDKKIYALTDEGHDELTQWLSTPSRRPPVNEPLLVKLESGDAANLEDLAEELQQNITRCQAKIETYQQIEELCFSRETPLSKAMRMRYLTLKNGIAFEQYWLDWAIMAKEELADIKKD